MIRIREGAKIENPRNYESDAVNHLRYLLEAGGRAQPDPRRRNFFEIEGNHETYFIHISPVTGNVVLLAKWLRHSRECCLSSQPLVA